MSAEELGRETGEEQIAVGWTPRKDGGCRERQSYVSMAEGDKGGQV